ncbi:ABC transporter permease subunit [Chungangia koreensis]|uniref:ABC transporter permease subunit n=1 Tax=Chungangia koreensis TaxID=752657 RepID=A0ABV8X8G3_9LACT
MLNLFRNEWMKLINKKSTWIMVAISVAIIFAIAAIDSFVSNRGEQPPAWEKTVSEQLKMTEQQLAVPGLSADEKKDLEEQKQIFQYRLDEKVAPLSGTEEFIYDTYGFTSFVTLMTVIVAAGIVASEFSQGTIKMLLSRPVKRWKILTSKFLAVGAFGFMLTFIAFVAGSIAAVLFYDASGGALLALKDGQVTEVSLWGKTIWLNLLGYLDVLILASFAFAIGTVFRSSSLAIGISIFLMFTGSNISFFLAKYDIVKYILFTHTFTQVGTGEAFIPGISTSLAVTVMTAYFIVFMAISYLTFTKRDVTA